MKKGVLIFDLDQTLFDTHKFMQRQFAFLRRQNISKAHALEAYERLRPAPFDPVRYVCELTADSRLRKSTLAHFKKLFVQAEEYWYDGVEEFLREMKKDFSVVLLTYGRKSFQMKKLTKKHHAFFDHIIVTAQRDKRSALAQIRRRLKSGFYLMLDDKRGPLDSARALGMRTFRVRKSKKDSVYFKKLKEKITSLV